MKKTSLLLSLAAAVAAVGAGHLYLTRLEAEISGGPKLAVLVAAEDVALGTPLSEKLVALRDVPQAYLDSRQIRGADVKKVLGARVSTALKANDGVLWSDVSSANGSTRVLSGLVERGMRAVAIDARSGNFEGLLRPGDRVDVLFTAGAKGGDVGSTVTLLQNLLVLSVGGNIAKVDEASGRGSWHAGSVTVAASVEDAQILTQAKERGRLSLTLRNSGDITLAEGLPETTSRELEPGALAARERRSLHGGAAK
jgi:Flp pilus assembly protein CpaB